MRRPLKIRANLQLAPTCHSYSYPRLRAPTRSCSGLAVKPPSASVPGIELLPSYFAETMMQQASFPQLQKPDPSSLCTAITPKQPKASSFTCFTCPASGARYAISGSCSSNTLSRLLFDLNGISSAFAIARNSSRRMSATASCSHSSPLMGQSSRRRSSRSCRSAASASPMQLINQRNVSSAQSPRQDCNQGSFKILRWPETLLCHVAALSGCHSTIAISIMYPATCTHTHTQAQKLVQPLHPQHI